MRAAGHLPAPGEARSYLDDGRLVLWRPATELVVAVDAERRRPAPSQIARRADGDVWTWWTRLEVVCKLLDVPVLAAVRAGRIEHDCALRVVEVRGVVVCFGARRPGPVRLVG